MNQIDNKPHLILIFLRVTFLFSLFYILVSYWIEFREGVGIMALNACIFLGIYSLLQRHLIGYKAATHGYIGNCLYVAIVGCSYFSGGLFSPVAPWFVLVPVIALLLLGAGRSTILWVVQTLGVAVLFVLYPYWFGKFPQTYAPQYQTFFFAMCWIGIILIVYLLSSIFEYYTSKAQTTLLGANEALLTSQQELSATNEELLQQQEELTITLETVQKQSYTIQKINQDITASIKYAQHIQWALLPSEEQLNKSLGNYFVLFQPLNIVSGDFYWCEHTQDITFVAVADCTGHGVPGAFMSMLGIATLNSIIFQKDIYSPEEILTQLHQSLYMMLRQHNTESRDGMDIVLLAVHHTTPIVACAGAMNSLYYVKQNTLIEIKGDKKPVGGCQHGHDRAFTKHLIMVDKPITFYLCSDGFQDQFGGKDRKKFGKKRLRESLLLHHQETLVEQKNILATTLKNWITDSNENQIDDILVLGFALT